MNEDFQKLFDDHKKQIEKLITDHRNEIDELKAHFDSAVQQSAKMMKEANEPPQEEQQEAPQAIWSNGMLVLNAAAAKQIDTLLGQSARTMQEIAAWLQSQERGK